jgi:hypothetical protein
MKIIAGVLFALLMVLILYHTLIQEKKEQYTTNALNIQPTYDASTQLTTFYTNEGMPCFLINLKEAGVENETNINMNFLPSTHFKRPTMQQCLTYVNNAVAAGVITPEQIEPKLIACTQQSCMQPWIRNLAISSPGV